MFPRGHVVPIFFPPKGSTTATAATTTADVRKVRVNFSMPSWYCPSFSLASSVFSVSVLWALAIRCRSSRYFKTRYMTVMRSQANSRMRVRAATSSSSKFSPSSVSTRPPKFQPLTPSSGGYTNSFSCDGTCTRSLRRRGGCLRLLALSFFRRARRLARSWAFS